MHDIPFLRKLLNSCLCACYLSLLCGMCALVSPHSSDVLVGRMQRMQQLPFRVSARVCVWFISHTRVEVHDLCLPAWIETWGCAQLLGPWCACVGALLAATMPPICMLLGAWCFGLEGALCFVSLASR